MMRLAIVAAILLMLGVPARAALLWNWSYSGNGVSASATFTTSDAPDGTGYYKIIRITGAENGVEIAGLQPTGTAIPGQLGERRRTAFDRARLWLFASERQLRQPSL